MHAIEDFPLFRSGKEHPFYPCFAQVPGCVCFELRTFFLLNDDLPQPAFLKYSILIHHIFLIVGQ
jgi:hypothetical protein